MNARPIHTLGCLVQRTLIDVCLSEDDLRRLGVWGEVPHPSGFSVRVRSRALLHRLLLEDEVLATRVGDLLDLRHVETVLEVRASEPEALERAAVTWLSPGRERHLPAVLWATCTDPRARVLELGHLLCQETITRACRLLVEPRETGSADS